MTEETINLKIQRRPRLETIPQPKRSGDIHFPGSRRTPRGIPVERNRLIQRRKAGKNQRRTCRRTKLLRPYGGRLRTGH